MSTDDKRDDAPEGALLAEQLRAHFSEAEAAARRLIERARELAREASLLGVPIAAASSPSAANAGAARAPLGASDAWLGPPLGFERARASSSSEVEKPEPTSMLDREAPPERYGTARARALPVDPSTVVVFWEWPASLGALEAGETRVLQLVSTIVAAGEALSVTQWVAHLAPAGDYFFRGLPPGAEHTAFVGVLRAGVFEPVLFTEPVRTPHGEPSAELADVRATMALPERQSEAPPAPVPPPRIVRLEGPAHALEALAELLAGAPWSEVPRVEAPPPPLGAHLPFGPRPVAALWSDRAGLLESGAWAPSSWRRFSPGPWPT